jgi:hypothetical protein
MSKDSPHGHNGNTLHSIALASRQCGPIAADKQGCVDYGANVMRILPRGGHLPADNVLAHREAQTNLPPTAKAAAARSAVGQRGSAYPTGGQS